MDLLTGKPDDVFQTCVIACAGILPPIFDVRDRFVGLPLSSWSTHLQAPRTWNGLFSWQ
jgi:hypothetical protein